MRLWHYELIRALPDAQLVSQWRELCAIASRIETLGYPNHLLVNKVMDYSHKELLDYGERVIEELYYRHFNINSKKYDTFYRRILDNQNKFKNLKPSYCGQYKEWHTKRYYYQCYLNLQEKHDCGGISNLEWNRVAKNQRFFSAQNHAL